MDIGKAIEMAETYLREFILYLVSFFHRSDKADDQEIVFTDLHRSVVFAIVSAVVGAYMWERYINSQAGLTQDITGILADNMLRWLSLGITLFALLRLCRVRVQILVPILAVLKVFSVAHIVAIYVAYLVGSVVEKVPALERTFPMTPASPIAAAYGVELLILWFYFWRETRQFAPVGSTRTGRILATFLFLCLVSVIVLILISEYFCNAVLQC